MSDSNRIMAGVLWICGAVSVGCGGDGDDPIDVEGTADPTQDNGNPAASADEPSEPVGPGAQPGDDQAAAPGSEGPGEQSGKVSQWPATDAVRTNMPGATITTVAENDISEGLRVASMYRDTMESGTGYYEEFYAVVVNEGTRPACLLRAEARFMSGGSLVAESDGYADADNYYSRSIELSMPCIAPGGFGVISDNGFADEPFVPADITDVELSLDASDIWNEGDELDELEPTIMNTEVKAGFMNLSHVVTGTAIAEGGTVNNVFVIVYPVDDDWMVYDRLVDAHLETLEQGASWEFETAPTMRGAFSRYAQFLVFGSGPADEEDDLFADAEATDPIMAAQREQRAQRRDVLRRLAQHRASLAMPANAGVRTANP